MTKLPDNRAREVADTIDAYEQQLADAQEGKRETFQTVRIELENLGLGKADVKAELDGLKRAIKLRQLRRQKPEKLDQEEAAEALAVEYLDRIEAVSRAPRATRTRERVETTRIEAAPDCGLSTGPAETSASHQETSSDASGEVHGRCEPTSPTHSPEGASGRSVSDLPRTARDGLTGGDSRERPATYSPAAIDIAKYRPHCRNPEVCAGVGLKHCFACQQIADSAAEAEAA